MKKLLISLCCLLGCASSEKSNPYPQSNPESVAPVTTNTLWWRKSYHLGDKDNPWDTYVIPPKAEPLAEELKHFESSPLKWPEKMPPAHPQPEKSTPAPESDKNSDVF